MSIESAIDDGAQYANPFDRAKVALFKQLLLSHTEIFDLMPFLTPQEARPESISLTFTVRCGEGEQQPETFSAENTLIFQITAQIHAELFNSTRQTTFGSVTTQQLQSLNFDAESIFNAIVALDFADRSAIAKNARDVLQARLDNYFSNAGRGDLLDHIDGVFNEFEFKMIHALTLD